MELCCRLDGDKAQADLLCVEADALRVATGSEAGTLSLFDTRTWAVAGRVADAGGAGDALTSLAFHPRASLGPTAGGRSG